MVQLNITFIRFYKSRTVGSEGLNVIEFNIDQAIEKVKNARVIYSSNNLHGESDNYRIWIPSAKMNDTYLLGTMLHESLHYICTFNGKDICSKDEHYVMNYLGDDC